jgi:hypothetical protein
LKSKIKIFLLIGIIAGIILSCAKETVVIGDPATGQFKPISVAAIKKDLMNNLDQPVVIGGKMVSLLPPDFVFEKDSIMIMTDFGEVVVVLPKDKYTETLWKVEKGDLVNVYGAVSTITPPGKKKALLAVTVD